MILKLASNNRDILLEPQNIEDGVKIGLFFSELKKENAECDLFNTSLFIQFNKKEVKNDK